MRPMLGADFLIYSMIITWHGEGCFKLQNGEVVVLTDAPKSDSGISVPKISSSLYIKTISALEETREDWAQKSEFVVRGAGEYDVRGVRIRGWQLSSESSAAFFKTIYRIEWDDIIIGLLGHVSEDIPAQLLTGLEEVDVLIGPGGGEPFLSQEKFSRLVKQLNPKICIPSFYKIPGLKRGAKDVKDFLAQFNGDVEVGLEKFVFKKKDIQDIKKTKVICLKP